MMNRSMYQSLLESETHGSFFLRATLQDYVAEEDVGRIIVRTHELLSASSEGAGFVPVFKFEAIGEGEMARVRMTINKPIKGEGLRPVGKLDFVPERRDLKMVEYNWEEVTKGSLATVEKISDMREVIEKLRDYLTNQQFHVLFTHLSTIEAMSHRASDKMSAELVTASDGITLKVFSHNNLFSTCFIRIN